MQYILFIIPFVFSLPLIAVVLIYNEVHYSKYKKLITYLRDRHPEVYEQIRIKPIIEPFFATGAFRNSILYATNHQPLNDPVAEELLSDYANFPELSIATLRIALDIVIRKKEDLGYNRLDIASGLLMGLLLGTSIGAFIGTTGLPGQQSIGLFWGVCTGLAGGSVGGFFGAVREFGWEMPPIIRSIIAAIIGALGWVMAFSFINTMFF